MKKILKAILCLFVLQASAQENLNRVSENAGVVLTIKGGNITKKVPENLISTSPIFKEFQREFFRNSEQNMAINEIGVDVTKDIHFALENTNDLTYVYFIYPLKNKKAFENAIASNSKGAKIAGDGYEGYASSYGNKFVVWNKDVVVYMLAKSNKIYNYNYGYNYDYRLRNKMIDEVLEGYLKSGDLESEYAKVYEKYKTIIEKNDDFAKQDEVQNELDALMSEIEETVEAASESPANQPDDYYSKKSEVRQFFYQKDDERREEERNKQKEHEKTLAKEKLKQIFSKKGVKNPITKNEDFLTNRDEKADAILWTTNGVYYPMMNGFKRYSRSPNLTFNNMSVGGMQANLYFEQTQARVAFTSFYGDSIKKYTQKILNTKLNSALTSYISNDAVAYWTMSFNMEEMLHAMPYYYASAFNKLDSRYKDEVDLATTFFKILLDEKEAAQIFKGDAAFVLLGIEEKDVTYTTYEMDENFVRKEVTKTKKEPMPKFRVAFVSETQELFEKVMRIGVKKGGFIKKDDYYVTVESGDARKDLPFKMYVKYSDGIVLVSTEKQDLMGKFNTPIKGVKLMEVQNNSSVIYYNNEKLMQQIPAEEIRSTKSKKLFNYLLNYSKDASFSQKQINGEYVGELKVNIPNGVENSAMYFFNIINKIIEIDQGR